MADEKDIVERLRTVDVSWSQVGEWCAEAAAEIASLRAALAARDAEIAAWLRDGATFAHAMADQHGNAPSSTALRTQADTFATAADAIASGQYRQEEGK